VTFEIIFWAAIVVVALLYISYFLVPKADALSARDADLKATREERARLADELARKDAIIKALKGDEPSPDVIERELRKRNFGRADETRISLADD